VNNPGQARALKLWRARRSSSQLRRSVLASRGNLTAASLRVTRFGADLEAAHTWDPDTWPCTHTRIGGALVLHPQTRTFGRSTQAVRSSALEPSIGVRCNIAGTGVDADDHGVVLVRVRDQGRPAGPFLLNHTHRAQQHADRETHSIHDPGTDSTRALGPGRLCG
jgi:hypothetical protein